MLHSQTLDQLLHHEEEILNTDNHNTIKLTQSALLVMTPRTTQQNKDPTQGLNTQWEQQKTMQKQHNHRLRMKGSLGHMVGAGGELFDRY